MAIDPVIPSNENLVPVTSNASVVLGKSNATANSDDRILSEGVQVAGTVSNTVTVNAAGANITGNGTSTANKPTIKQRENVLHDYVNWTYQVGWYMLKKDTFNKFVEDGKDSAELRKYPIFRSGGFKENSTIDFDMGLTSLRLHGVIGNNQFSPNANQYSIEMEIVEPFGVNFLSKLRIMAQQVNGINAEFQVPYLLDIKWLGYNDNGQIVTNIPNSGPKLISVVIIDVKFNITAAGTKYNITFAPYAQMPLSNTIGVIRTDTRVYGGTLGEVLKTGENSLKSKLNAAAELDVKQGLAQYADKYDFEIISFSDDNRTPDNKLADAPMTFPVKGGTAVAGSQIDMSKVDVTKQMWPFMASSNVKDIISDLARHSKYFWERITSPTVPENSSLEARDEANAANTAKVAAMATVKVIPMIKLLEYDTIRGEYQKEIVYKVVPFFLYGQINPRAGIAPVSERGFVKEYNWLFTGKNKDVFNIDLNYNLLYFRLFQTNVNAKAMTDMVSEVETSNEKMIQASPGGAANPVVTKAGDINARSNRGDKPNAVQEYFEQQLNPSYGSDLISMDLDIIGDPDWIVQDRSVRPAGIGVDANNNGYVDGDLAKGISVDVDGVYVNINFRTPVDYDDKTGLMKLSDESALISGFYQVITIDSIFENGRFTQQLHLTRVPSQEKNIVKKGAATQGLSADGVVSNGNATSGTGVGPNVGGAGGVGTGGTGSNNNGGAVNPGILEIEVRGGNNSTTKNPSLSDD